MYLVTAWRNNGIILSDTSAQRWRWQPSHESLVLALVALSLWYLALHGGRPWHATPLHSGPPRATNAATLQEQQATSPIALRNPADTHDTARVLCAACPNPTV